MVDGPSEGVGCVHDGFRHGGATQRQSGGEDDGEGDRAKGAAGATAGGWSKCCRGCVAVRCRLCFHDHEGGSTSVPDVAWTTARSSHGGTGSLGVELSGA